MTAGPPWNLSTYDGYRAFLVACGNPPPVVEEVLRVYFPDGPSVARKPQPRPAKPEQLAFEFAP